MSDTIRQNLIISKVVRFNRYFDTSEAEQQYPEQPEHVGDPHGTVAGTKRRRLICGLSVARFWLLIALILIILGGPIGAGVGVELSNKSPQNLSPSTTSSKPPAVLSRTTSLLAPTAPPLAGWVQTISDQFELWESSIVTHARFYETSATFNGNISNFTLTDGISRSGSSIAVIGINGRLSVFENPPALTQYNAGFSLSNNGSLAFGDSTIWYDCYQKFWGRWFYYNRPLVGASGCDPVLLQAALVSGTAPSATTTSSSSEVPSITSTERLDFPVQGTRLL